MQIYHSALEMIGETPMLELNQFDTGPCRLLAKLECQNPGGSIKDRVAVAMINAAEQRGELQPGGTIIEATAGNTGIGLGLVASVKGYRLIIVLPDKMSKEKILHLRAIGCEVVITRSDVGKGHPAYYQDLAAAMAAEMENVLYINQFANADNPATHYQTTGPEIWQQTSGQIDALVCGVGTSGTLTGAGRYLKEQKPSLELIVADPEGSILTDYIETGTSAMQAGSWLVEGIGEDFVPDIADLSLADRAFSISDQESFTAARQLLQKQGILAGSSSGTLLAAALRYCQQQTEPKTVVTLICDSGNKYLSKLYNDYWMMDHGFINKPSYGDLRDFIGRPHSENATVIVGPDEPLSTAHNRMRIHDISQLPVMVDDKIIGLIGESDLLLALHQQRAGFNEAVRQHMTQNLQFVQYTDHIDDLLPIFQQGCVAIVMQDETFLGIITQIDLVNQLRRTQT